MVILDELEDSKPTAAGGTSAVAGQHLEELPPSFEESTTRVGLEHDDPPVFTPYDAEYSVDRDGTVTSSDDHLNQDGECDVAFGLVDH